jgi:hypothetical protein
MGNLRPNGKIGDSPAGWGRSSFLKALLLALCLAPSPIWAASRALVIGIDDYAHVPKLRGAVADARDVDKVLRAMGVSQTRLMVDGEANRRAVLDAFEQLLAEVRPGDTVYLALAGHGAEEPERVKGSQTDGLDAVFLLQPFDPRDPTLASEKILDAEFNHYIRKIEAAGGRAIFIADTCSGGGLARSVDPRAGEVTYRSVKYTPITDKLQSIADRNDSFASRADFERSLFLAAVDKKSRVPELMIPGVGYRGALSYAFARALEGSADANGDGTLTAAEIFNYVRQVAHELSDQRQVVVLERPARHEPQRDVVAELTRGIAVRPYGAAEPATGGLEILAAEPPNGGKSSKSSIAEPAFAMKTEPATAPRVTTGWALKLAALDGRNGPLNDLPKLVPVTLVAPNADPDLVWDSRSLDVLAGPDVVARNISASELPGVIERTLLLRSLKQRASLRAQPIRLLPGDDVHAKGTRVEIEIGQLKGRYLLLFDLAGNGAAQLLYPLGSDAPQRDDGDYSVGFQVREPFGADLIVAVTANRRLDDLEKLLKQSARRLNPDKFLALLSKAEPQELRLGYVGLFTSP